MPSCRACPRPSLSLSALASPRALARTRTRARTQAGPAQGRGVGEAREREGAQAQDPERARPHAPGGLRSGTTAAPLPTMMPATALGVAAGSGAAKPRRRGGDARDTRDPRGEICGAALDVRGAALLSTSRSRVSSPSASRLGMCYGSTISIHACERVVTGTEPNSGWRVVINI